MKKRAVKLAVEAWFRKSLKIVGLSDWKVTFRDELPEADEDGIPLACIFCFEKYRTAEVLLSKEFWELSRAEQRATLAHELCHLFWARADSISEQLQGELSPRLYGMWKRNLGDAEEYCVEQMSRLLCERLPYLGNCT